jgi:capsular polysaccharide biosynthesis protein
MELRAYWRIIWRHWWLPLGLALLVGIITLAMQRPWHPRATTYQATMRFNVGLKPQRIPGVYTYDDYYTELTSEYLVDDLGEIVRSQAFTGEASRRLAAQGISVSPEAISASTQPGKLHRILTVMVTGNDESQLRAIAGAVSDTLTQSSADFFGQFNASEADIRVIDPPIISPVAPPARQQLDLPLRVLLALAAGVGLAFLWDYLDDSVRSADELEGLGLPVLGQVPRY